MEDIQRLRNAIENFINIRRAAQSDQKRSEYADEEAEKPMSDEDTTRQCDRQLDSACDACTKRFIKPKEE